jgi:hypothetical protein
MSYWFGKNCPYLCCQWEENEVTGGPNYKEAVPGLFYCNHENNPDKYEGNCNKKQCPINFIVIKGGKSAKSR